MTSFFPAMFVPQETCLPQRESKSHVCAFVVYTFFCDLFFALVRPFMVTCMCGNRYISLCWSSSAVPCITKKERKMRMSDLILTEETQVKYTLQHQLG